MMIDTHIHLVPGVDDGAKDLDTALDMARLAINEGIYSIIATPHYNIPDYKNEFVFENFYKLVERLKEEKLELELYLGNEIHLNEEGVSAIFSQEAYSLANSDYYLIELPFHQYYPAHEELIFQIIAKGKQVILAHIERYVSFQRDPEKLINLIQQGCYGQLTSSYLTNAKTNKRAMQLIEAGLVHIIASDGHNLSNRAPKLLEGYQSVRERFGEVIANQLFDENPKRIIKNQPLLNIHVNTNNIKKKWYNFFTD
jgi:protein-tyrosine phosphatase